MTVTTSNRARSAIAETLASHNADRLVMLKGYVNEQAESYEIRYQKLPVAVDSGGTQVDPPKQYKIPAPGCVIKGVSCFILVLPGENLPDIEHLLGLYVENGKTGETVLVSNFLPTDSYETPQGRIFRFDDTYSSGVAVKVDNTHSSFVLRYPSAIEEHDVNMCHGLELMQVYEMNGRQ